MWKFTSEYAGDIHVYMWGGGGGAAHYAGQQSNFSCAPQGINQGIGGKGVVIVRWS